MLVRAQARGRRTIEWVQGDALALPYATAAFDAATVGFGVRNVADLEAAPARARARPASGWAARHPRDHAAARAPLKPLLLALVRSRRAAPRHGPPAAARRTRICPASVRRFPGAEESARRSIARGRVRQARATASSAAPSSRCTRRRRDERDARDVCAPRPASHATSAGVEELLARSVAGHPGSSPRSAPRR